MSVSRLKLMVHCAALFLALGAGSVFFLFPADIGSLKLVIRTLVAESALLLGLFGMFPFLPWFFHKKKIYLSLVCAPALAVCAWYFLAYIPSQAVGGISAHQLESALISERSSNGYVEIGFAYPIYTPTISISNNELYTKELDVYLRIIDGNNEAVLFRAVREVMPDARLTVEATVNGLLSESAEYLFIPIAVPPGDTIQGRLVFVISDLNDGSTFDEALGRSYPAEFELRDPRSDELVVSFPMTRI